MQLDRFRRSRGAALFVVTLATFVDIIAYSIAVPVLPVFATTLGASPTVVGLLFAAYGVTLLAVSIPLGVVSDRIGRRAPMVVGLFALALATLVLAFSRSLPHLFVARLIQGAASAVTWVVGFALIADLYGPAERGKAMGIVMAGTGLGIMVGPPLGGWLYEIGGITLPFIVTAALAAVDGIARVLLITAPRAEGARSGGMREALRVRAIVICALAVVAGSGTISMLEPVLPLHFASRLRLAPGQIGALFGFAALSSTLLHPIYGRFSDRYGGRKLTLIGLIVSACLLPLISFPTSLLLVAVVMMVLWGALSMTVTPSLTFMGEAASAAGLESYGVVYGIYNVAWATGMLFAPAIGGFVYERLGLGALCFLWAPALAAVSVALARAR